MTERELAETLADLNNDELVTLTATDGGEFVVSLTEFGRRLYARLYAEDDG